MTNEPEAPEAELSARLRANCVGQPAEIAWPHRILHEAANALDAKDARIAELETAIKRQAGAAKTLRNSTLAEVQHIKDNERKEYIAIKTLDSEREANAILTEENEALQARIAELEERNTDLGEAVAYATQRIAEADAERDEQVQWVKDLADDVIKLEAKLAKAVRLMELSVELATWNTTLLDDVILFITKLKESEA